MKPKTSPQAFFYPFHLCHARTLEQLLDRYEAIHFRDYMALQLTPLAGTTAFHDRMGALYPDLVAEGRIVQGHNISGPLRQDTEEAVDRDLADHQWRDRFHRALSEDRRFQQGLFDLTHSMQVGKRTMPGPAALLELLADAYRTRVYTVARVKDLTTAHFSLDQGYDYEYGMALLKTSASLVYTVRLALQHGWVPVTDSPSHFELLERSCTRDGIQLLHELVPRVGY